MNIQERGYAWEKAGDIAFRLLRKFMRTYLDEAAIIADIKENMTPHLQSMLECNFSKPGDIHSMIGFGRFIRNHYGLWDKENPLVRSEHPDDVSGRIIEQLVADYRR